MQALRGFLLKPGEGFFTVLSSLLKENSLATSDTMGGEVEGRVRPTLHLGLCVLAFTDREKEGGGKGWEVT